MNNQELENYRKVLQEEIDKGLPEGSELKIYQSQQQLWENNKDNVEMTEIMYDLAGHPLSEQLDKLNEMLGIKTKESNGASKGKSQALTYTDGSNKSMYYGVDDEVDDGGFTNIILLSVALIVVAIVVFAVIFLS